VSKFWQRLLVVGAVFAIGVSGLLVRPLAAADDFAAENKLFHDWVVASDIIRENYVEAPEYELLTRASISAMLRTLDPHSNFYDRKSFDEMRREQRSHYYGIGATIQQRFRGVYIIEPFKDTPAVRAGLRFGDQIVAIDGNNTENWNSDQVRNSLRGELGTTVKVTVRRAGVAEPVNVSIERGTVDLPSVSTFYVVRPGIGYINLSRGFHSTTSDELTTAIASLKEQGAKSMILDLRGNPGGFLDQAIKVSDKFLERGQIVLSVRGREGRAGGRDWPAESGSPETFPLVVLINRNSASASEIVAGAVQDHDRGLIVGENSFGKGLVQTIFPLSGGAGLTLTTARYYTPSGRLIQRDYSNGSFYEYLSRRNASGNAPTTPPVNDEKKTDLGRAVFGGGGIEPDVKVAAPVPTNAQFNIWSTGLFMFTRELLAGKVAGAPNFRFDGIKIGHKLQPGELVITDDIMKQFREFMVDFIAKNPEYNFTMAMVDENMTWLRSKLREEVVLAFYGLDVAQRAVADQDPQMQKAIQEIPNAAQLAERARRVTQKTSRN
jgi:carboxyl-terminal processing protease